MSLALVAAVSTPSASATSVFEHDYCAQFSDMSSPIAKDSLGNEILSTNVSQLVIMFSTFSNPCSFDQEIFIVTEVRDHDGATIFFQSARVEVGAFNSAEVGSLWHPNETGTYELRSFAFSNSTESQILTDVQTHEIEVVDYHLIKI